MIGSLFDTLCLDRKSCRERGTLEIVITGTFSLSRYAIWPNLRRARRPGNPGGLLAIPPPGKEYPHCHQRWPITIPAIAILVCWRKRDLPAWDALMELQRGIRRIPSRTNGPDRLQTGYGLFIETSGNCDRYFWIGRPFNSEGAGFNKAPAFRSCANKMMTPLLRMGNHSRRTWN